MEKTLIDFRKKREFGEVINATFSFIGQEFKKLLSTVFVFVLPFFIIYSAYAVYYQYNFQSLMAEGLNLLQIISEISNLVMLIIFIAFITYAIYCISIFSYIKNYIQKGSENFKISDIWVDIKKYFLKILLAQLIISILVIVGSIFLLIPGIYLIIVLSFMPIIIIFEDKSVSNSFSLSFNVIRNNWWRTFGLAIVVCLIMYAISIIFSIPIFIVSFTSALHSTQGIPLNIDELFSPFMIVYSMFINIIKFILMTLMYVSIAFQYFSLKEQNIESSLVDKIDQLGQNA